MDPMLHLAKLLHSHGFFITFVLTSYSREKIQSSEAGALLKQSNSFHVETIPDGYSQSDSSSLHVQELLFSIERICPEALEQLLKRLSDSSSVPPVTSVIANFLMTFVPDVAAKFGIPSLVFWTTSACGLLSSIQIPELIRRGYVPLKDQSCLTNGYLDTVINWIPGMKEIRLRELSSSVRTMEPDDFFIGEEIKHVDSAKQASGPLLIQLDPMNSTRLSLWDEDSGCMEWLSTQNKGSVIYVSFGSLTTLTRHQLVEFAWGLADSSQPFVVFWVDLSYYNDNSNASGALG